MEELLQRLKAEGYKAEYVYAESFGTYILHVNDIAFHNPLLNAMNGLPMGFIPFGVETIKKYCKQKELLDDLCLQSPVFICLDSYKNYSAINSMARFIVEFYPRYNNSVLKYFGGNVDDFK